MQSNAPINTPISWPLDKLLEGWATLQAHYSETSITGLSIDSRSTKKGDLFFAMQGLKQHGLEYSPQAIANDAAALVWESSSEVDVKTLPKQVPEHVPCLEVKDLQAKLGLICQRFYSNPSAHMNVIAVTGTDGKTSVSQFIAQALQQLNSICGVIGTLGYGVYPNFEAASHTTPDAVRMQGLLHDLFLDQVKNVVLEASSHGLSQSRLNGVEIDTAVFTNLGRDHMDYHQTIEDYFKSKRLLFQSANLKNAVINIDDEFGFRLATEFSNQLNVINYSIKSNNDLSTRQTFVGSAKYINALNIMSDAGKTCFEIDSSWGPAIVKTNLIGKFNVSNLLAVMGALLVSGIEFDDAVKAISAVHTVPGRMELITKEMGASAFAPAVVIDYAHTPQALMNVLKVLRAQCEGRLWCVFGCGGNRDQGKRKLMAEAVEQHADVAVVTDDNPRFEDPEKITDEIVLGFSSPSSYLLMHNRKNAIEYAIQHAVEKDVVLIAGKGHEAIQIIKHEHLPFDDKKIAIKTLQEKAVAN
jgi:UDP-N-acetylmuramoyl-L-alanyl-D-glutamate--2,6-diaminopimelate ligase